MGGFMDSSKMTKIERAFVFCSVGLLCLTFLSPLWRIEIFAPQYPEGLLMQIGLSSVSGNVDQINILNHYIGMKRITAASIPELRFMPLAMGVLVAMGVLAGALNRRWLTALWTFLLVSGAFAGLLDFYLWGYDYGHNLDPNAPIKVPGMSYQPPLIGHKLLLNIHSYSLPDWGGIALALAILLGLLAVFWRKIPFRRLGIPLGIPVMGIICLGMIATGCTSKQEPIQIGVDSCATCRMRISDARFGGEIIMKKRKILKFDSIPCLLEFHAASKDGVRAVLVSDYLTGALVSANEAHFLRSSQNKGPMGDGLVASEDLSGLKKLKASVAGELITWKQVSEAGSGHRRP